jgi:hypothetical protein
MIYVIPCVMTYDIRDAASGLTSPSFEKVWTLRPALSMYMEASITLVKLLKNLVGKKEKSSS